MADKPAPEKEAQGIPVRSLDDILSGDYPTPTAEDIERGQRIAAQIEAANRRRPINPNSELTYRPNQVEFIGQDGQRAPKGQSDVPSTPPNVPSGQVDHGGVDIAATQLTPEQAMTLLSNPLPFQGLGLDKQISEAVGELKNVPTNPREASGEIPAASSKRASPVHDTEPCRGR